MLYIHQDFDVYHQDFDVRLKSLGSKKTSKHHIDFLKIHDIQCNMNSFTYKINFGLITEHKTVKKQLNITGVKIRLYLLLFNLCMIVYKYLPSIYVNKYVQLFIIIL